VIRTVLDRRSSARPATVSFTVTWAAVPERTVATPRATTTLRRATAAYQVIVIAPETLGEFTALVLAPVLSRVVILFELVATLSAWVSDAVGVVAGVPDPDEPADVDEPPDVRALCDAAAATAIDRVDVPVRPSLWVTVSVTVEVPALEYVCEGLLAVELLPSPKLQL
jgi:hypothetical protein